MYIIKEMIIIKINHCLHKYFCTKLSFNIFSNYPNIYFKSRTRKHYFLITKYDYFGNHIIIVSSIAFALYSILSALPI